MVSAKPSEDKLFVCPGCQRGNFKSLYAVRVHFEAKNHPLICGPCNQSFDVATALLSHSLKHEKQETASKPSGKQEKTNGYPKPLAPIPVNTEPTGKSNQVHQPPKHEKKDRKKPEKQDHGRQVPEKQRNAENTGQSQHKSSQKFVKGPDLSSVKPVEPMPKDTSIPSQPRREYVNGRSNPSESRARNAKLPPPSEAVFTKNPKGGPTLPFGFGDTLLHSPGGEAPQKSPQFPPNYHVHLEPLEQELIFRYLSARCHSDTRLTKHGFTSRSSLNEKNKRPPKQYSIKSGLFAEVSQFSPSYFPKSSAIVLDCEMVQVEGGRREVAFISAIDFLTGKVLINNYVQPTAKVVNWDSRFSGITPNALNKAVRNGTALNGWEGARSELWKYMNRDTVLVGHSLNNDLDVLGILHGNIVDSSILTSEAVFLGLHSGEQLPRTWSLKTLASELVNYNIQVGKNGHNALEDAHATRDVVIWCIRYPELLKAWADNAREEEVLRAKERELKKATEEQVENQKRMERESRMQALSHSLGRMAVATEFSDELDHESVSEVNTGYITVTSIDYF